MKKIIVIMAILFLANSSLAYAKLDYSGLVKCDGVVTKGEEFRKTPCDFNALIDTVNKIINWMFVLAIPFLVGLLAYAGFLYMKPNATNRTQAQKMMWNALIGFVIMLVAWFLVTTFLGWVLDPDFKGADTFLEKK